MKNTGKVIIGLCLITAGVLWILNIVGVLPFTFSTKGWWALFVIVPCLCALFSEQKDKVGPCIGIGLGVLLLLAARDDSFECIEVPGAEHDLKNPAVIVDCNHSNSGKQFKEQIRISKEVLHSMRHSEDVKKITKGLMIESYIEEGCQKVEEHIYGKSITDPCLGWDDTEKLILEIADLL